MGSKLKSPSANEIVAANVKYGPQPQSCTVAAAWPMPIGPETCGEYFENCVARSTMPSTVSSAITTNCSPLWRTAATNPTRSKAGTGENPMQPRFRPTCGGQARGKT